MTDKERKEAGRQVVSERFGTIFEVLKTKAVRHRVPQASWQTSCGVDLYYKIPENWLRVAALRPQWHVDHNLPKETRCRKCYPKFRSRRVRR